MDRTLPRLVMLPKRQRRVFGMAGVLVTMLAAMMAIVAPGASASAQAGTGTLEVTPRSIVLGESFSMSADACPAPMSPFGDYRVEFVVEYLPPPQLPGDPDPGSYSVTLDGVDMGAGVHVATWAIPQGSPTLGSAYRVSATCFFVDIGPENVWFTYTPVSLQVVAPSGPTLSASPSSVIAGEALTITADGCPGAFPLGASYRVEYTLSYVPLEGETDTFSETFALGIWNDHQVVTTIPIEAPSGSGQYLVRAECRGDELGADFLVHTYPPVAVSVSQPSAPGIGHAVTCLAGNGRVDTNIVNVGSDAANYRIEFEGLTPRQYRVLAEDWWRMPITGRPDGDYQLVVKRDGVVVSDKVITVACDAEAPQVSTPEVQVVSACRAGRGYILVQFANPTPSERAYIIDFPGVVRRSTTAAEFGQSVRAVTGRSNGTYLMKIRTDNMTTHIVPVIVDCL